MSWYFDQFKQPEYRSENCEFYTDGVMSIGVSFEDCDIAGRNEEVYIYNLFYRDQYINISGYGRPDDLLPLEVLNNLCTAWNELLV